MNNVGFRREALAAPGAVAPGEIALVERTQAESLPILRQYLAIIRRRKWIILGSVAAMMVAALVVTMLMTPLYTATSTIEIQREGANIVNVEGVESDDSRGDEEFYQTQYGLLKARSLAERVARDLRLHEDQRFLSAFEMDGDDPTGALAARRVLTPAQRDARIRVVSDILLENVDINPVRMSRLVDVEFTSPDPQLSAAIVNAWTRLFVEQALERRFDATAYARRFLEERLGQLGSRLEQSERALVGYAARQGIVNLGQATTGENQAAGGERPLVADQLAAVNQELQRATADRVSAQSRLQTNGATNQSLNNATLAGLRQRRAEAASEYSRMLVQFEPEYPPARALAAQLQQLDRAISAEEGRVRNAARNEYQSAATREAQLARNLEILKGQLFQNRARSIQYNIFQRDVDTNQELYQALLQRYKEIGVAGGVGINNIAVVDSARIPERPSSPNLILNMLVALLAGLAVGAGLAFALEQVDEAIADPSEIENKLRLPILGAVPKVSDVDLNAELADRKSSIAEAYLSIQTSLEFSTDHGVPRSVVITSTRPGEGKSTTSYALAQSLARTGRSVVLVDGDMRSPSIHNVFGLSNDHGMSNYLAGEDDLSKLIAPSGSHGIAILPAGPQPPNAAELLTGPRLGQLFEALKERFDHIVIDAPPVMGLADAPLLTSRAEGTVYVIESHGTRTSMAHLALSRLQAAQARILGCVLTKFESRRAHYGYGYDYGYGYGDGDARTAA
jgi:succinoglycan biosynthesis transport protein ExoP